MLPETLEEREIIFWPHVAYEMKSIDQGEHNGILLSFIRALHEELKQRENLLCRFIAFFLCAFERKITFFMENLWKIDKLKFFVEKRQSICGGVTYFPNFDRVQIEKKLWTFKVKSQRGGGYSSHYESGKRPAHFVLKLLYIPASATSQARCSGWCRNFSSRMLCYQQLLSSLVKKYF